VINMVSRGITTPNILRGIHDSMAGRFVLLLRSIGAEGVVLITGGLASDLGLVQSLRDGLEANNKGGPVEVKGHPLSIHAGALGAAIWGEYRFRKLNLGGAAWTANTTNPTSPSAT